MKKLLLLSSFILSNAFINLNTYKIGTNINNNYNNIYNNIYNNKFNFCMTLEEEFENRKKKYFNDIANDKINNSINNQKNNQENKNNREDNLKINFNVNQLTLLDNQKTINYTKKWIKDMIIINGNKFPQYMYKDMYIMREFGESNKSLLDFYIGYYPFSNKDNHDPIYIGYFSVNPFKRLFCCKSIIQNPNYNDNESYIIHFKYNIEKVSKDTNCKLIFEDLKNLENKRYWMSWFYN